MEQKSHLDAGTLTVPWQYNSRLWLWVIVGLAALTGIIGAQPGYFALALPFALLACGISYMAAQADAWCEQHNLPTLQCDPPDIALGMAIFYVIMGIVAWLGVYWSKDILNDLTSYSLRMLGLLAPTFFVAMWLRSLRFSPLMKCYTSA